MHLLFFSFSFGSSHSLFHPFYHSTFPRSLSLSLHPYSPPRGRPSFAPHVDESQTRPTVTGRALNWAEGANAKVLPRFSPPTRKGNDPLFVRGKERGEEGMKGGGRAAIRRPVNSWVYVTCYGHGSVVRWLDEGGWTYNVYRGKDDRAEWNRIPPVWRLSASITITEFRLLFLTYQQTRPFHFLSLLELNGKFRDWMGKRFIIYGSVRSKNYRNFSIFIRMNTRF